jgi:hypothetical protein
LILTVSKQPFVNGRWPDLDSGSSPSRHDKVRGRAEGLEPIAEMNMVKGGAHPLHLIRAFQQKPRECA